MRAVRKTPSSIVESLEESLFEGSADPIALVSFDGVIFRANSAFCIFFGEKSERINGQNLTSILSSKSVKGESKFRVFDQKMLRNVGTYESVLIPGSDNQSRITEVSVRPGPADNRIVSLRDTTEKANLARDLMVKHAELLRTLELVEKKNHELKATQEVLIQAGKLAALGELTAGVSHELHQPLQALLGFAGELHPTNDQQKDAVEEIKKAAERMAKIVKHLRVFTRRSFEDYGWQNLHQVIRDSIKLLSQQLRTKNISVIEDFSEDIPPVWASSMSLEQVFINLVTNARDAILEARRKDGKIHIKTRKVDSIIEIEVQDNGSGISGKILDKIFNPFFTTKEVGKGMGLGLSLAYGTLTRIGGSIQVQSQLERGTTFTVRIPVDFRSFVK